MNFECPRGVVAPLLTPFNDDLSIATDLYLEHANNLLREGCVGLAPFGTTGEALSVGIDERIAAVRSLVDGGIDPALLMPGTGLSNVADTARLSRACLDMGCRAVMTLPPFYYKGVSDEGLFLYFSRLVNALGGHARIFLYHIPPIAGVGISVDLATRLQQEFPGQIVGIKDSSGNWDNTQALLEHSGLVVYPGSELPLIDALQCGAPGCVSATANVNAADIAQVISLYDTGDVTAAKRLHESVSRQRLLIQDYGPIPAQKRLLAMQHDEPRWAHVRPPLLAMDESLGKELATRLQDAGEVTAD